ncbi:hypothetical protein QAD02_013784 [Eretmocerus hayati]|uniref:Uncharacterized protein n=1 Tax=Eretmocerus hayati TaxID=131215 RepID=A0ACC2P6B2_9HYME|nr:hypothetical protein QAD02_013784 [Eretmocerus hayati]
MEHPILAEYLGDVLYVDESQDSRFEAFDTQILPLDNQPSEELSETKIPDIEASGAINLCERLSQRFRETVDTTCNHRNKNARVSFGIESTEIGREPTRMRHTDSPRSNSFDRQFPNIGERLISDESIKNNETTNFIVEPNRDEGLEEEISCILITRSEHVELVQKTCHVQILEIISGRIPGSKVNLRTQVLSV